jgi:hypothetical protein
MHVKGRKKFYLKLICCTKINQETEKGKKNGNILMQRQMDLVGNGATKEARQNFSICDSY